MAENTAISWADATHNHWVGCTKVSPACDGCYAEHLMDTRHGRVQWGKPGQAGTLSLTGEANRRKPLMWHKKALAAGTRPFVFCSSLSDVFDNQAPAEWRRDLFDMIRATPALVWLLLTKRPQNIVALSEAAGGLPPNAALGTTIEDKKRAAMNGPALLRAGAALDPLFLFYSCEPLIEIITPPMAMIGQHIAWVITGGETDQGEHKARPTHPDAFRQLRDQAAEFGAAFHHKQWGEWADLRTVGADRWEFTREVDGKRLGKISAGGFEQQTLLFGGTEFETRYPFPTPHDPGPCMVKVGKARSGRLLDGVEHNARPWIHSDVA